jgi:hypothetical protein
LAGCFKQEPEIMHDEPDKHDSSQWTGYSEPIEAEALMLILAVGAICFLFVGIETL